MEYTGSKRSLTMTISKFANGTLVSGYPKTYDGKALLVLTSPSERYEPVTDDELATMSVEGYEARFEALIRFVQSREVGFQYTSVPYTARNPKTFYPILYDPICLSNFPNQ